MPITLGELSQIVTCLDAKHVPQEVRVVLSSCLEQLVRSDPPVARIADIEATGPLEPPDDPGDDEPYPGPTPPPQPWPTQPPGPDPTPPPNPGSN